jgi:hypothetical protein
MQTTKLILPDGSWEHHAYSGIISQHFIAAIFMTPVIEGVTKA